MNGLAPKYIKDLLSYDPFSGDDSIVSISRDKVINCRKNGICHTCAGDFFKGDYIRALTQLTEDIGWGTYRFCFICCNAMIASVQGSEEAITRQESIGYKRRQEKVE